jgi:hypothetical protein
MAALCMLHQRVPKSAIICVFTTLQNLSHTVRTADTYGGSFWVVSVNNGPSPMHGIMQGNGKGPALWTVISSPVLVLMLHTDGFGTIFKLAITGDESHFVGFSFVNDIDQIKMVREAEKEAEAVVEKMQGGTIDC